MTGRQQNRPELDACLNFLREGDTLVVYKLDRLGRSLKNILTLLEDFKNRGIQFTSLQDNISTEGAIGQLMNNILGAFAQFERDLIYERTQEGRRIAKEKGVKFGRKTLINKNNIAKQKSCIQLYESGTPVREIQKILNIGSSGTVYRLLRRNGITLNPKTKIRNKSLLPSFTFKDDSQRSSAIPPLSKIIPVKGSDFLTQSIHSCSAFSNASSKQQNVWEA